VYDTVYLIAHGLDELYRSNPKIKMTNFNGICYEENSADDWSLGKELYFRFSKVFELSLSVKSILHVHMKT
jgi:hypothetical protein